MAKMSPLWLLKYLPNMPASHLAIYNDFRGPNNSLTMREASANAALGEAYQIILRDDADIMLVGSTGTRLHPMKAVHAVSQEEVCLGDQDDDPATASRPFDRDRRGMVLGEGAGAIVLEELSKAQARGATIYGEVLGAATSSVAGRRLVACRGQAMQNVLRATLQGAGANPDDVGHLHAHGLSTRTCDIEEAQAIQAVFAARKAPLPVVAAKSYFGNLGAGSGMVELIASLLALRHDHLFPILNYATPDPECPVATVCNGDAKPGSSFLNLNVTPQGQASAALVRRFGWLEKLRCQRFADSSALWYTCCMTIIVLRISTRSTAITGSPWKSIRA
jgi:3-oxoacyl-[acyl-carrier-protein] synthase II